MLTHCGFGGMMDAISAGKPVLAWPAFADQPSNAELLLASGMAQRLGDGSQAKCDLKTLDYSFESPVFTKDEFVDKVRSLITEEIFAAHASRLRIVQKVSSGPQKAVKAIENAFLAYSAGHMVAAGGTELLEPSSMVDKSYNDAAAQLNLLECLCFFLVILPVVIGVLLLDGFDGILKLVQAT